MSDLIARLESIAPPSAPGDWLDVVARAERQRGQVLRRRLIVAIAVALLALPTIAIANYYWDFDFLSLSATEEEVPVPQGENTLGYVIDDRVKLPGRPPAKLAAHLRGLFVHPRTPLVISSADRSQIVYHAWEGRLPSRRRSPLGTPVLRLFDAQSGQDVVLARGAHSAAWRADGALAYTQAVVRQWRLRRRGGRIGHVVVRSSPQHAPVRWSTFTSEWTPLAWAGRHLIAQARVRRSFKWGGFTQSDQIFAFSGPARSRRLPFQALVAVSPDGRLVLGRTSTLGDRGGIRFYRVVEVASGRTLATLRKEYSDSGAWLGDTIILTHGVTRDPSVLGPYPPGVQPLPGPNYVKVVVLRFSDGVLRFERELRLTRDVILATGLRADQVYFGFTPPAFVDSSARHFTTELVIENILRNRQLEMKRVFLTCDRLELRCRRGASLSLFTGASLVYNPSRPLPD
jgi:hypothetical protein